VLHVGARKAPEEVSVLVSSFAVEAYVANGKAGRGAVPIKSERDHGPIFGHDHPHSLKRPNRRRQPIDLNARTRNQPAPIRLAIPCHDLE
jgi:hypothetical protein